MIDFLFTLLAGSVLGPFGWLTFSAPYLTLVIAVTLAAGIALALKR